MTKKYFEQPELMVVHINNTDIMTISVGEDGDASLAESAGRRFDVFDIDESWANAGY